MQPRPSNVLMTAEAPRATRPMPRSQISGLTAPDAFLWATGIEDTFITEPHHATGRSLDEYELTEHYDRWRDDLRLASTLGITAMRYGIPWYRVQPTPDTWDWTWPDQAFALMEELGIAPLVDLVHYGVPAWLEQGLLDPDFPPRMAEYARRMAERYRGRVLWYTPLNEPRVNAWYCGRIGWWPPYLRGWSGFARLSMAISKAIVLTTQALRAVDDEIVILHVDASDHVYTNVPELEDEIAFRRRLVFIYLDLITGRMSEHPKTTEWLHQQGIDDSEVAWFEENSAPPDIAGFNLYPIFSQKELVRRGNQMRFVARYANRNLVEGIGRRYYERYGLPVMLTETATKGSAARRVAWLHESLAGVRNLREEGVPIVGYTWWPMFSLVSWGYRQTLRPISEYVVPMGLWDLDQRLDRIETSAVAAFRGAVSGGSESVGLLTIEEVAHAV